MQRWLPWLGALFLLAFGQYGLTPPSSTDPEALAHLDRLLDGVGPHPVGSPASRTVEKRLVDAIAALGVEPQVEESVLCANACVRVRNVLAPLPGKDPSRWILFSTHYDSVFASEGAADDGAGVAAALTILGRLREEGPLETGVLFLFNEGEERGLLGAQAFVRSSAWRDRIEAAVNLEARGVSGASYLFQVTGSTASFAPAYGEHASSPSGSSLYVAIYRMLPNNTDATIYSEAGIPTVNFAFLGEGQLYHTPRDHRHHLDPRSVGHHVEQGLAAIRALAALPPGALHRDEESIFFDIGGHILVHMPVPWARAAACLLALAVMVGQPFRPSALGAALLLPLGSALSAAALDWTVHRLGGSWAVLPGTSAAFWCWSLAWFYGVARLLGPYDLRERLGTVSLIYAVTTLLLAAFFPSASYLTGAGLPLLLAARIHRYFLPLGALAGWPLGTLAVGLPDALGPYALVAAGPAALAFVPLLPFGTETHRTPAILAALPAPVLALVALTQAPPAALVVHHLTDGERGWVTVRPAHFPRGGRAPRLQPASTSPPLALPGALVGAATPDGYVAPTIHMSDAEHLEIHAPGGWAMLLDADGPVQAVEGAPTRVVPFVWYGDTSSIQLTITPQTRSVDFAVARPAPVERFDFGIPWEPVHTGALTWSWARWTRASSTRADHHLPQPPQAAPAGTVRDHE